MKRFPVLALIGLMGFCSFVGAEDVVIAQGKKIKFDYKLTVDGQVVDSSEGKQPIEYVQGDGKIIPGLSKQLEGLKAGDEKTITVPAAEGYGDVDKGAVKEVPRSMLPKDTELAVGQVFEFQSEDGVRLPGIIKEIKDQMVLLDFNHPLAGKELKFEIKIVSVE